MSDDLPSRPRHIGPRHSFAIVASQYNAQYVGGLVEHARRELEAIAPGIHVQHHEVPGAFEIPLVVQEIAQRGGVDAVLAFGVIITGQTAHASLVGTAVTDALLSISLATRVPVIHEVLLLLNEEQARRRCLEEEINRGTEAARTAVRMAQVMGQFTKR